jgi:hypothetical protein
MNDVTAELCVSDATGPAGAASADRIACVFAWQQHCQSSNISLPEGSFRLPESRSAHNGTYNKPSLIRLQLMSA